MIIRGRDFDFKNDAYIMGILNVTPDSFSDGGKFNQLDAALKHVEEMIAEGADFIDIGGESTRPGHIAVSSQEEMDRLIPIIEGIRKNFDVAISVDTYKADTLKASIEAGADLLNDVWGMKYDKNMAKVAKDLDIPVILMHNKDNNSYKDLISDICFETMESVEIARKAGISDDKIILDPGIGFALDYEKDLIVINRLEEFVKLGYPVLLGTSRKRFIGKALDITEPSKRQIGTATTTVVGLMKGASIFRVHDVKENYQALKMALAIRNEGR